MRSRVRCLVALGAVALGCGAPQPPPARDPCDERCALQSEWFAGCMMGCRQERARQPAWQLGLRDASPE